MICEDHEKEILEIANAIGQVCAGKDSACVYAALSMVIGGAAASAPRPDFETCLALVKVAAHEEFTRRRALLHA